jgi:hypothetical protein
VTSPRVPVERSFLVADPLSRQELEAILEVAFQVVAVDGRVRPEELEALERVAATLAAKGTSAPLAGDALGRLLDDFARRREREGQDARLEAIAAALPRPTTRALAYRVACAMAMCDRDADDREFELDLSLIAALGLPQQTADDLAAEVHEALAALSAAG